MIGKTISHYKILEKIGAGGMGVVFKAEDTTLQRPVALKFLPPVFSTDQTARQRFIHEARAASSLDHPNICTIFEIDETEDGQSFIAMAYYEGESLKEKIAKGPLDVSEATDIFGQVLHGLERAHESGIVHRDIKPANIMITHRGEVKILDFGLAKLAGQTVLTQSGSTLGTMAYMSPEQIQGKKADGQSDIWSCGVVMYEMLTGKNPFKEEFEQAIMYTVLNEKPTPIDNLPDELWNIIQKCLAKNPENRYPDVSSVIGDLDKTKVADTSAGGSSISGIIHEKKSESILSKYKNISIALILLVVVFLTIWYMASLEDSSTVTAAEKSNHAVIVSGIIGELMNATDTDIFMEKINNYRSTMRIIVGNKDDFESPSGCYVFVLDDKKIEAAMRYENDTYTNLNSGERISDLQEKYKGKKAIWVKEVPN